MSSGKKKPEVSIRRPGQKNIPSEEAVRALEAKAEAAQAMPAGVPIPDPPVHVVAEVPVAEPEVLAKPDPIRAPEPEVLPPEPLVEVRPASVPEVPAPALVSAPMLEAPRTQTAPAPKVARQAPARAEARPHQTEPSPPRTPRGSWTKAEPYHRKRDGVEARSTTIYLDVHLLQRLRRYAFENERRQSDVVAEALELLFTQQES